MSEVIHKPRTATQTTWPGAPGSVGLSVRQVVSHVERLQSGKPTALSVEQLIDTVDVCVRMGAQRQVLSAGLGTQEALDRLAQIAWGREAAYRTAHGNLEAVESARQDMQSRLTHILTDWRQSGERFARITRLLPAQLTNAWPTLPDLDRERRHALEQMVPPALRSEFERARDRYLSAQRRSLRAIHEVERGREDHHRLDTAFRNGRGTVAGLAQTLLQLQRQVESQCQAVADRLVSQHVMELLARQSCALSVV